MRFSRSGGAHLPVIIIGALVANVASRAHAQPVVVPAQPAPEPVAPPVVIESLSATWPLALSIHALIGFEPHDRGIPVAFGAGTELLWRGTLGGFAALLAAEGTPIIPPATANAAQPGFGDRISVPFGFAAHPLTPLARRNPRAYWARLVTGIGLQVGVTVEHVRTSDDDKTTAGLHLGLGVDLPLWGGLREGGVSFRVYGRLLFTPEITLDCAPTC